MIDDIALSANPYTDIQQNTSSLTAASAAYYNNAFAYQYPKHTMRMPVTTSSPITPQPTDDYKPLSTQQANNNNPNIKVKLQDMQLWKSFNQIGTEMIITKTGR